MTINDITSHADKYVGQTLTYAFTLTGSPGGPTEWTVGVIDPTYVAVSGPSTGTGSTFGFDGEAVAVGTGQFLVQAQDTPTGQYASKVVDLTVVPTPIAERTGGTEDLTDADLLRLTKFNTPGGGTTCTIQVSAAGRGGAWWAYKNTGSGNLTLQQTDGELIDGSATKVVAPGGSGMLFPDNSGSWATV